MSELPSILFAPVLRAEGWTSIDLQQADILHALRSCRPDQEINVLAMTERAAALPLGRRLLRDVLYPRRIRAEARRMKTPAVLHVSDHSYGHLCRAHDPCVVNCNDLHHHVRPELGPLTLRRWRQRVDGMRHARKILAISEHLAGEVREFLHLPDDQVIGLPGGIDRMVFRQLPDGAAAALLPEVARLRADHLLVLNIGSNIARKNLPVLLRALHRLKTHHHLPVKLVKAGPALLASVHAALIHELGMEAEILDLGLVPPTAVAAACNLAHVLAFPSLYEGFGRPTLEAQACGLPCVLADSSCMREVGGTGALYHAAEDREELAEKLAQALTDDRVRGQLVQAGLRNVERFSWTRYAQRLVEIYQEVAAS